MVQSLPPIHSPLPPAPQPTSLLSSGRVAVNIIGASLNTPNNNVSLQLRGQITQVHQNGTVVIATDRGTVTAQLPGNIRTDVGQSVEINLPANALQNANGGNAATLTALRPQNESPAPATNVNTPATPPPPPDPANSVPLEGGEQLELNTRLQNLSDRLDPAIRQIQSQVTLEPEQTVLVRQITLTQAIKVIESAKVTNAETLLNLVKSLNSLNTPVIANLVKTALTLPLPTLTNPANTLNTLLPFTSLLPNNTSPTPLGNFLTPTSPTFPPTTNPASLLFGAINTPLTSQIPLGSFTNLNAPVLPTLFAPTPIAAASQIKIDTLGYQPLVLFSSPTSSSNTFTPITNFANFLPLSTATNPTFTVFGQNQPGDTILAFGPIFANDTPRLFQVGAPLTPLPTGSTIKVALSTTQPLMNIPTSSLDPVGTELLNDLLELLETLDPAMRSVLFGGPGRPPIPNAANPQQLGAGILLFLSMLRSGDLSGWLNDRAIETLRRSSKNAGLFDRLSDTLAALKQRLTETPIGEWRSIPLPLQWQNETMRAGFHVRSETDDQQNGQGAKGQRFVLDLTFDRMGAVQMDMLFQPGRLDSILRTELPLSQAMRGVLEVKYAGAMEKTRLTGVLNFQDGRATWVTIQARSDDVKIVA